MSQIAVLRHLLPLTDLRHGISRIGRACVVVRQQAGSEPNWE